VSIALERALALARAYEMSREGCGVCGDPATLVLTLTADLWFSCDAHVEQGHALCHPLRSISVTAMQAAPAIRALVKIAKDDARLESEADYVHGKVHRVCAESLKLHRAVITDALGCFANGDATGAHRRLEMFVNSTRLPA
jgi:hypothetical protein